MIIGQGTITEILLLLINTKKGQVGLLTSRKTEYAEMNIVSPIYLKKK